MPHSNQRSHLLVSSPFTSTTSTFAPQSFSEKLANIISRYQIALPQLALAIAYERNSGLNGSENEKTLCDLYRNLEIALTADWFKQESGRLQQRGRMIVKNTVALHGTIDLRGAEAAVEKCHLRRFC